MCIRDRKDKVEDKNHGEIEELEALFTSNEFKAVIEAFISSMKNPNTPDVYMCSEGWNMGSSSSSIHFFCFMSSFLKGI